MNLKSYDRNSFLFLVKFRKYQQNFKRYFIQTVKTINIQTWTGFVMKDTTYPNPFEPIKDNKHHVQWIEYMFADMVNKHHTFSNAVSFGTCSKIFRTKAWHNFLFMKYHIFWSHLFSPLYEFSKDLQVYMDRKISCCLKFMLIFIFEEQFVSTIILTSNLC